MAKRLTPEQWKDIEIKWHEGHSARTIAKEYGITEGAIRFRLNPKKKEALEIAVAKTVEAKKAVLALPEALRPKVETMAEKSMRLNELTSESVVMQAQNNLVVVNMIRERLATIDPLDPDIEKMRMVLGLTETANKLAWQPIELLKLTKKAGETDIEAGPLPTPVYRIVDGT